MTRFLLIRHGDTLWTKQKKYQGQTDIELSKQGRKKIRGLSSALKSFEIHSLYTSSLKRARQSSEILSAALGIKPRTDARLNELNFGQWEGKTAAELLSKKDKPFFSWTKGKWKTPAGGESLGSLRRRVRQFLRECVKKHRHKNVAIVSHGGPIRMMIVESLRLPERFLFSFRVDPASVLLLTFA